MSKQYSYDEVKAAEKAQNGGRSRLICNRTIDGKKCVCYAREIVLGDNRYWNLHYKVDGTEPAAFNGYIDQMYEIAHTKSVELYAKGILVILWKY